MRTKHRRTAVATTVAALALTVLTACGSEDSNESTSAEQEFNDADVAFATDMIPHHAQALTMVEMTEGRELDPEVEALTEDIRDAQAPEIETMTGWLESWDEPVPETDMGHDMSDMEGMEGMEGMEDMPGMMSADDMKDLENASDQEFQTMWLEMMIVHHEGAVEMAQTEQAEGMYPDAIEMAEGIESSQTEEIATMEELIAQG